MTYTVYHIYDRPDCVGVRRFRSNVNRTEAKVAMEKARNFKQSKGRYIVVAADKDEIFWAQVNAVNEKRQAAWAKKAAVKAQRWETMEQAWVKGYRVTDAIEYLKV